MDLLFKREQTPGKLSRVNFKLWGKVELDENEQEIVKRYRFENAVLIEAVQPNLLRKAIFVAVIAFIFSFWLLASFLGRSLGMSGAILFSALAGIGAGYWYLNEKRETIFVKDLLHGRHFTCESVVELARKEAWLSMIVEFFRQVMESAKHWEGTERHTVEALPKDEARQVIIKGI